MIATVEATTLDALFGFGDDGLDAEFAELVAGAAPDLSPRVVVRVHDDGRCELEARTGPVEQDPMDPPAPDESQVTWVWTRGDTVLTWEVLHTPPDEKWLSYLSGALPPFAHKLGFKKLVAPSITEELRELLPLTGLEPDAEGVMTGVLGDKRSRFWQYLDFKAGRKPEPAWRAAVRQHLTEKG